MQDIFNADYAHAFAEPEKDRFMVVWKKKIVISFDLYQTVYNTILDYHKINKHKFFIADLRDQGVMQPTHRKWFQEYVLPTAAKNGLKKGAVIFDGNVFKKYFMNHIMDTGKKFGVPIIFVGSVAEAEKYFNSSK